MLLARRVHSTLAEGRTSAASRRQAQQPAEHMTLRASFVLLEAAVTEPSCLHAPLPACRTRPAHCRCAPLRSSKWRCWARLPMSRSTCWGERGLSFAMKEGWQQQAPAVRAQQHQHQWRQLEFTKLIDWADRHIYPTL